MMGNLGCQTTEIAGFEYMMGKHAFVGCFIAVGRD
jgi:hypothetical protein